MCEYCFKSKDNKLLNGNYVIEQRMSDLSWVIRSAKNKKDILVIQNCTECGNVLYNKKNYDTVIYDNLPKLTVNYTSNRFNESNIVPNIDLLFARYSNDKGPPRGASIFIQNSLNVNDRKEFQFRRGLGSGFYDTKKSNMHLSEIFTHNNSNNALELSNYLYLEKFEAFNVFTITIKYKNGKYLKFNRLEKKCNRSNGFEFAKIKIYRANPITEIIFDEVPYLPQQPFINTDIPVPYNSKELANILNVTCDNHESNCWKCSRMLDIYKMDRGWGIICNEYVPQPNKTKL